MSLIPLLPLFHQYNRQFFDDALTVRSKPRVALRWSDARLRKTAGFYRRGNLVSGPHTSEIVLSSPLLRNLPGTATQSTLCHEMIHAWIDLVLNVKEGHGHFFRSKMNLINSSQDSFRINVRHKFPVPSTQPKWLALCPSCGLEFPYKRLVRGAACRKCCDAHHRGHWDESCLLIYKPFSVKEC